MADADHDLAYWTAAAYALLGQEERALSWLERSMKLGFEDRKWIENDKCFISLRNFNDFLCSWREPQNINSNPIA